MRLYSGLKADFMAAFIRSPEKFFRLKSLAVFNGASADIF
jgi:hypothetical protein